MEVKTDLILSRTFGIPSVLLMELTFSKIHKNSKNGPIEFISIPSINQSINQRRKFISDISKILVQMSSESSRYSLIVFNNSTDINCDFPFVYWFFSENFRCPEIASAIEAVEIRGGQSDLTGLYWVIDWLMGLINRWKCVSLHWLRHVDHKHSASLA